MVPSMRVGLTAGEVFSAERVAWTAFSRSDFACWSWGEACGLYGGSLGVLEDEEPVGSDNKLVGELLEDFRLSEVLLEKLFDIGEQLGELILVEVFLPAFCDLFGDGILLCVGSSAFVG